MKALFSLALPLLCASLPDDEPEWIVDASHGPEKPFELEATEEYVVVRARVVLAPGLLGEVPVRCEVQVPHARRESVEGCAGRLLTRQDRRLALEGLSKHVLQAVHFVARLGYDT